MADTDKVFAGDIPAFYDDYLVPLIFGQYAEDLAARVAVRNPRRVLETAAGSGVVTRALAGKLTAGAQYVVTDLNQPMLDHAKKMQGPDSRIRWQQADALDLPFDEDVYDVVCCQFGVMFFPDRRKGYAEARRVLTPGGAFIFNVWDKIEENEFADAVTKAAGEIFHEDPPVFLARTPHGLHDVDMIRSELVDTGFAYVEFETISGTSVAPTPRDPAIAYCYGTPLRNEIEARDASRLDEVTERAARRIETEFGRGPVSGKIQGHVFVATL